MALARTNHRKTTTTAAVVAALAVAATLLWPSASVRADDASSVHACVVPSSGHIRIVDSADSCRKNEVALAWQRNGGASTQYGAGFGLALDPDNVFSVTGAPWGGLTNVPAGFADNVDDDGAAALWSNLTSGALKIGGSSIAAGSLTAQTLAGAYGFSGEETTIGAVTSEKIADGTIAERDLSSALVRRLAALEAKIAELEARLAALEAE